MLCPMSFPLARSNSDSKEIVRHDYSTVAFTKSRQPVQITSNGGISGDTISHLTHGNEARDDCSLSGQRLDRWAHRFIGRTLCS
jgi:hypothetical protein